MSGVTLHQIGDEDNGRRLDRWLREHFPQLTQGRIEKLLRKGEIRVEGARAKFGHRLEAGMTVRIPPLPGQAPSARNRETVQGSPEDRAFLEELILYADDHLFVLNKPPGLPVQGGTGQARHIDGMLPALARGSDVPKLVHRLDKDTSGLLVIARSGVAARSLAAAFQSKAARKTYWAACIGVPRPREGTIKASLTKAPGAHGEKMIALEPDEVSLHPGAKRAVTDFAVVDTASTKASWVAFRPVTGRTHQLRVHSALIGCPIVGDGKYGPGRDEAERRIGGAISRKLHLHARRLTIPHPDSAEPMTFEAPLSDHMLHSGDLFGWDAGMDDDDALLDGAF